MAAASAGAGTGRPGVAVGLPPTFLLIALLFVPGVVLMLCLDFWRLCRRDPDARDSSANGRHSVLVGNSSFIWKRGPSKKKTKPLSDVTFVNGMDTSIGVEGGGAGGTPTPGSTPDAAAAAAAATTTPPLPPAVPDIAAELPYLLPADAASAPSPSPQASPVPAQRTRSSGTPSLKKRLGRKSSEEDYQCPGGDGEMPYRSPADELRRSVPTAEEEPYYAVPVHRVAAEPAPLPPPRRRQART